MSLNPYETRRYLEEYLLFHYGRPRELCPYQFIPSALLSFHQRLRREYLPRVQTRQPTRALDLGCAVGRFTFELASVAGDALGIDNSSSFIRTARRIAQQHRLFVQVRESGKALSRRKLTLPESLRRAGVQFETGDATNLRKFADGSFHYVAAINLIDRLPCPRRFLLEVPRLLAAGGLLIMASPFTWLEEYTPAREWLSIQQVQTLLGRELRLMKQGDLPFVIREHQRKYQLVVARVFTFGRPDRR
ncbi:MAG TPA: methyltransferase domain-containing protein [Candidatus Limnocylindrales bacterium]|nr:methyltransferase domain-containing protein [Candidatus Limnocylindrales bacterium]